MVYMGGPQNRLFQFYGGRDVKNPTNYIYLDSIQWDLKNGAHIDYQYSFEKKCRKAVKFFFVIIEKTFFDHNPGYFEYFTTFNILKCVELNSLQLLKLMLSLLSYTTEDN
jgi:hypothetical protein